MKAFVLGVAAAAVLAFAAAMVLDYGVQEPARDRYQTGGVRL